MNQANAHQIRSQAALSLCAIAFEGQSANDELSKIQFTNPNDTSLYKALVLGSCRYYVRLEAAAKELLRKPFKPKDSDLLCLLLVGLYQLQYSRIPDHAAISETVNGCRELKKEWATKLINGVLRNYSRQQETINKKLDQNWNTRFSFPDWLIDLIKPAYKGLVESLLDNLNQQAPMTLRVNLNKITREQYLELLAQADLDCEPHSIVHSGITLTKPVAVDKLPGFEEGLCSVQDGAAQLAAELLSPERDSNVLDACAAPGGKASHLLELSDNDIVLDAVDIDPQRCFRIQENFERLELSAEIHAEDALSFMQAKQDYYDAILLDVPCSATGVIRRHPDIKLLRRESDIAELQAIQKELLSAAWHALKSGGKLLYATCSILPQENSQQIESFLNQHQDASLIELPSKLTEITHSDIGCQIVPSDHGMDGFYYALMKKSVI